jgi:hypothetical protein
LPGEARFARVTDQAGRRGLEGPNSLTEVWPSSGRRVGRNELRPNKHDYAVNVAGHVDELVDLKPSEPVRQASPDSLNHFAGWLQDHPPIMDAAEPDLTIPRTNRHEDAPGLE